MKHWQRKTLDWFNLPKDLILFSRIHLDYIRVSELERWKKKLTWRYKSFPVKIIEKILKYRFKKHNKEWK